LYYSDKDLLFSCILIFNLSLNLMAIQFLCFYIASTFPEIL